MHYAYGFPSYQTRWQKHCIEEANTIIWDSLPQHMERLGLVDGDISILSVLLSVSFTQSQVYTRVHSTITLRILQGFMVYLFLYGSSYFQSIWSQLRMRTAAAAFYLPVKAAVQGCVGVARLLSVFFTPLRYKAWSLCLIHLHVTLHQFWFVPGPCWENVRVSPAKWGKKTDGLLLVLPLPPHPLMIQALQMACKVLAKERKEQQKQMHSRIEGQNRSEPNALTSVTNASALSFPSSISKPLCCISALLSSCYTAVVLRQRNSPDPHIVRLTTQFCMSQGIELK